MEYNFPFTMQEVCSLITYTYRYSSGDSIYVDCPVCSVHRKDKLNINFPKEYGFRVELITWDANYKGIDDFLLAQVMREIRWQVLLTSLERYGINY